MKKIIQGHISSGNEVTVLIDANSHSQDTNIQTFMDDTGLYDVMEDYFLDQQPSTYQQGQQKIDHIWGTPGILTATINASILPFGQGPNSDHAVMYLNLSFDTLTGLSFQTLCDPTHPGFQNLLSTDIKAATQYIKLVKEGFHDKNIVTRIAILVSRCQRTNQCSMDDE